MAYILPHLPVVRFWHFW